MKIMKKTVYLVGIKGVAMTALAVYLREKGFKVRGSDVANPFATDAILKKVKIKVLPGFKKDNIKRDIDLVVATGAHGGATNIEVIEAKKYSIPVFMHGEYLGKIMDEKKGIAVAGCHGKTTTSSMIAVILKVAGLDPSYAIGTAFINNFGPAGHYGLGKYFIAEADEYMTCPKTNKKPRFLYLNPKIGVITNVDYDHPDEFRSLEEVKKAYLKFTSRLGPNGVLIVAIDDPGISSILNKIKGPKIITYGFSPQADFQIEKYSFNKNAGFMKIVNKNITVGEFMINVPGKHNLSNALAALIVSRKVGLSWNKLKSLIKKYTGCSRRYELIAQIKNRALYDDYAHHPNEIKTTISAFKVSSPQSQLIIIFQPHTFSRTKMLFEEFSSSFGESDLVLVADIFPSAREKFDSTVNSSLLVAKINSRKNNAFYVSDFNSVKSVIQKNLKGDAVIVTMGAGDLYRWHSEIINILKDK